MRLNIEAHICPLCSAASVSEFCRDRRRDYFRCRICYLVFVPPAQYLSAQDEKAEYDLHRNHPNDPGYRRFLSRLFRPLQANLIPGSQGLDFGCGPGPALSLMFEAAGHRMTLYDPFYARQPAVLESRYDFITASEVVEHLHHPGQELDRLWGILEPGGSLGLMTKLVVDRAAFARWHYKNDPSHVCFFSRPTFTWLADKWQAELAFVGKDVMLFHKNRNAL